MRVRHALIAAVIAFSVPESSAATLFSRDVAGWGLAAYAADDTGKFSHCVVSAKYKSGISLIFSVDKNYGWRIGFFNPEWNLSPGQSTRVRYWIDGYNARSGAAQHRTKNVAYLDFPDDLQLFDQFRRGNLLTVWTPGGELHFKLTGTSQALTEVLNCARQQRNTVSALSTPRAYNRPGLSSSDAKIEAARWFASVLANGSLPGVAVVTDPDFYKPGQKQLFAGAVAIWTVGDVLGRLAVSAKSGSNLDEVAGSIMQDDSRACQGTFASGRIPDEAWLRRVYTSCRNEKERWSVSYVIFKNRDGILYNIANIAIDNDDVLANASEVFKNAAFQTVK